MRTTKKVEAKRNRKPFVTEYKKYELKGENNTKYKIVNDLGRVSWENKNDFFNTIQETKYGFELDGGVAKLFCTPVFAVVAEDDEIEIVLAFICFAVILRYKKKR